MLRYIALRALLALLVAFTVSLTAFLLLNVAADPAQAIAGEDATPEVIDAIRARYGLDRSLTIRYFDWLGGVLRGDFGESYYWHQPVASLVW
ncbi:MAG: ABC transporter permease, partial [Marinomonas sp.]